MKKFSLPLRERIKNTAEYVNICRNGEKQTDKLFYLYVIPNQKPYNRLGIRISRKFGKAYKRNRSKRIIKEAYRTNKDILKGYDFVFIPRYGKEGNLKDFERAIKNIFLKIERATENHK